MERRSLGRALGALLLLAGLSGSPLGVHAADAGVVEAGVVPNYFYGSNFQPSGDPAGTGTETQTTAMFADPLHHRLFQNNTKPHGCPSLYIVDSETYRLLRTVGQPGNGVLCDPAFVAPNTSLSAPVAFDPVTDTLLLADNNYTGTLVNGVLVSTGVPQPELRVFSDETFTTEATWQTPLTTPSGVQNTPAQGATSGVSYDRVDDAALLTVGNAGQGANSPLIPGVSIVALGVGSGLRAGKPVVLWTLTVPQCQAPLQPAWTSAAAYRASLEDALYVPCIVGGVNPASGFGQDERDGVVKFRMTHSGCVAPATECPDPTSAAVAVAPGVSDDVFYDPGSDRIFMPSVNVGKSVSLLVYDGHLNQFLGAALIGGAHDSTGNGYATAIGLDPTTGRLYVANTSGLLLVDGRRTPVTPGALFPQYAGSQFAPVQLAVVPRDGRHAGARVFVNHDVGDTGSPTSGSMKDFLVFEDDTPVVGDPPPGQIDENTLDGPPPAGAVVQSTYNGTARGYGVQSDLVGGPAGLGNVPGFVNDTLVLEGLPPLHIPAGEGNRDVLGGSVERLKASNGSVDGRASALGIADDATALDIEQCTDAEQLDECLGPPTCAQLTATYAPGSCPSLPPAPSASQPTGQATPFPDAQCSEPGDAQHPSQTYDGVYSTSWTKGGDGTWQPSQSQVSGTDQAQARATVDCAASSAAAWLRAMAVTPGGGATVHVAQVDTTASVTPPAAGSGVVSTVAADARGIELDLGGHALDIAEVAQTATTSAAGARGSATASDDVSVSGVTLDGSVLCQQQCDPTQVAAALNQALPTQVFVDFPALEGRYDGRYLHCPDVAAAAQVQRSCTGSPGGYIAQVAANTTEQYGDEQFNGMPADVASMLPALRIVLYFTSDGSPQRTREVLDFAGVEADAERGFSALPAAPPDSGTVDITQAVIDATGRPATTEYIPGAPPAPALPPSTAIGGGPGGPLGVLLRTFAGMSWLLRSPLGALQMIAYIGVLALPAVLARRRRGELSVNGEDST